MKTGDSIFIQAKVLRVTGKRLDAQTADGQLIQTDVSNVMNEEKTDAKKEVKPKTAEKKSVGLSEHKAELNAPENKSAEQEHHRGRQ